MRHSIRLCCKYNQQVQRQELALKAVVLIDGEHYISVTKSALERLRKEAGYSLVGAAFLGSAAKIGGISGLRELGIPAVIQEGSGQDESLMLTCVQKAISMFSPEIVIDLSGEPVLSLQTRMRLASLILSRGISYRGADFLFKARKTSDIAERPAASVIALGKRVGKTAVGAAVARILSRKYKPVIITMGRGGPQQPELIDPTRTEITPEFLLAQADAGKHTGDNYENALVARVRVVGCNRVGGGITGAPFYSSVLEGATIANSLDSDFQIYQGSGTTSPGVLTDARILVVAAHQQPDLTINNFQVLRIREADMVVLTGCETPPSSPDAIDNLETALRNVNPEVRLLRTLFRPQPLGEVAGMRIIFATTAPESVIPVLTEYIENSYSCSVVGVAKSLTNRERFRTELEALFSVTPSPDVLLTELKAASVDVGVRLALSRGVRVIFCHNAIRDAENSRSVFADEVARVSELSLKRFSIRRPESSRSATPN